jgi:hypothetical protein
MRAAAILASLATTLLPQSASSNVLTFQCQGYSEQQGGDRVGVNHSFSREGKLTGSQASWSPRAMASHPPKTGIAINLEFWLNYSQSTRSSIGKAGKAYTVVWALSPPGTRLTPAWRNRDLAKLKIEVSIDGSSPVAVASKQGDTTFESPKSGSRAIEFDLPASARSIVFTARDRDGRTVNTTRYDLEQTTGRDYHYRVALEAANEAAINYKNCNKLG